MHDYETAIQNIDQAIEIDAKTPEMFNRRALINAARGNYEKALEDVKSYEAITDGELGHHVIDTRAFVYLKMGDYENAKPTTTKSSAATCDHPMLCWGEGLCVSTWVTLKRAAA